MLGVRISREVWRAREKRKCPRLTSDGGRNEKEGGERCGIVISRNKAKRSLIQG